MNHSHPIGVLTLALATTASAENLPVFVGKEVVVTATRTAQPMKEVLTDVSTIGPEELAKAGQSTLAEVLSREAGVEFFSNGGLGKNTDIFIRGANRNHTLILVDGVRLNSATTGTTAVQHIPLEQIERIEILRGPASSLYGADAIGGVIQIFTKAGAGKPGWNVAAGAGSYGTYRMSAGSRTVAGDTSLGFNLGYVESDGITAIRNPQNEGFNPDRDPYRNTSLSARLEQRLSAEHQVGADLLYLDGVNRYDSGRRTPAANPRNRFDFHNTETLSSFGLFSHDQITSRWFSRLRLATSTDDLTDFQPNTANTATVISVIRTDQNQAAWQNEIDLGPGQAIAGLEWRNEKVGGTTNFKVKERRIGSALAGYQARFGMHAVQFNARHDDNSQFGGRDTGSVSYGLTLSPAWSVSASAGNAFNAPTFNQLYHPTSGNPGVRPERAQNREVAVRYDAGTGRFGLVAFDNRVTDLIQFVGPNLLATNVSRATLKGTSLTYGGTWGSYGLNAALDLQDPTDDTTGRRLQRRAEKSLKVAVDRTVGAWNLGGELQAAGDRFDDDANAFRLGGYGIVNLTAQYRVNPETRITARVNNLFDKRYELARDFNTPGSNLFVTVQYEPRR